MSRIGGSSDLKVKSTIQCKFIGRIGAPLALPALKKELPKAAKLAGQGLTEDQVIMTNAGVSGETDAQICQVFESVGRKKCRVLVGGHMRRLRVTKGMTIEELADRARASARYVSHLERGQINPTLVMLEQVARPLAVRLVDLLVNPPPDAKPPKPLPAGRRNRR